MALPYAKRYAGGFFDLPVQTTPIDDDFLNALEAALLLLCATAPTVDKQALLYNIATGDFRPGAITEAVLSLSDLTTLDVSTTKHGFAPKAPNDTTKFLRGDGSWAAPTSGIGLDGWSTLGATLTYSSTDGHTFVVTTGGVDLTASIPLGSRIKLTHSAATKYFIVTAIDATTITFYGGTDYTLAATAITAPYYSIVKAPVGFPLSSLKWSEELRDTSDRSQSSPTSGTWYNPGSLSLAIPIGAWDVIIEATGYSSSSTAAGSIDVSLSTSNNSESDPDFSAYGIQSGSGTSTDAHFPTFRRKALLLTVKTTYYVVAKTRSTPMTSIGLEGNIVPTIVRAVCAYL